MSDNEVKRLVLVFPSGTSVFRAQKIAQYAEIMSDFGVSEGGFTMLSNPFVEGPMEFSGNEMTYIYGHALKGSNEKIQK